MHSPRKQCRGEFNPLILYTEHILRGVSSFVAIVYFLWVDIMIITMNVMMETTTAPMFSRLAVVA